MRMLAPFAAPRRRSSAGRAGLGLTAALLGTLAAAAPAAALQITKDWFSDAAVTDTFNDLTESGYPTLANPLVRGNASYYSNSGGVRSGAYWGTPAGGDGAAISNSTFRGWVEFVLTDPAEAVGLNASIGSGYGVLLELYDADDKLLGSIEASAETYGSNAFLGWKSEAAPISRVRINSDNDEATLIVDNVTYQLGDDVPGAPVPLPAAAPLLAAGLGAMGLIARRRRKG